MINKDMLDLNQGLNELNELKLPLNIKVSYILARNRQTLKSFIELISQERMNLYYKYGTQQDDGTIKIPNENMDKLEDEINKLLEIDNDVNITQIKVEDFGDVEIPFGIMEKLLPIIIEE